MEELLYRRGQMLERGRSDAIFFARLFFLVGTCQRIVLLGPMGPHMAVILILSLCLCRRRRASDLSRLSLKLLRLGLFGLLALCDKMPPLCLLIEVVV